MLVGWLQSGGGKGATLAGGDGGVMFVAGGGGKGGRGTDEAAGVAGGEGGRGCVSGFAIFLASPPLEDGELGFTTLTLQSSPFNLPSSPFSKVVAAQPLSPLFILPCIFPCFTFPCIGGHFVPRVRTKCPHVALTHNHRLLH